MNYDTAIVELNKFVKDNVPSTIPIKAENVKYEPILKTAYMKTYVLPAESQVITISENGMVRLPIIFQISYFMPIGTQSLSSVIDNLVLKFNSVKYLPDGTRIINSWRSPAFQDTTWYQVPINVRAEVIQHKTPITTIP
jgi:signal transduction histidine kinase